MESLKDESLTLNKEKTVILSDIREMKEGDYILGDQLFKGYLVVKSIKYLGVKITPDRKAIVKDAKASCSKF